MLYLSFTIILLTLATLVWLNQVIKQAVVEPVINGKLPVKVFSEKKRWQVLWDEWKFTAGIFIGFAVGWWL